jgi:hypothetical protein
MRRAIEAGVDCVEHGEFLEHDGKMVFDAELANRLVDAGIYLSPTLQSNGWDTILRLGRKRDTQDLDPAEASLLTAKSEEITTRPAQFNRLLTLRMGGRMLLVAPMRGASTIPSGIWTTAFT